MTGLTRAYDPAAVEALLAATRADPVAEDTHARLQDLLLAVAGALGARVAVVQAIDEGSVAFQVAAAVGLDDGDDGGPRPLPGRGAGRPHPGRGGGARDGRARPWPRCCPPCRAPPG